MHCGVIPAGSEWKWDVLACRQVDRTHWKDLIGKIRIKYPPNMNYYRSYGRNLNTALPATSANEKGERLPCSHLALWLKDNKLLTRCVSHFLRVTGGREDI
jgi:hypothetical protein